MEELDEYKVEDCEISEEESEDSMEWSDYIFETLDEIRELNNSHPMIFEKLTYSILLSYINYTKGHTMYNNEITRKELFKENTKTPSVSKRFIEENIIKINENYRMFEKLNTRNKISYNDFVSFLVKYSYKW